MLKNKLLLLASFVLISSAAFSQQMDTSTEEPSDFMNANGKIFVVMAVVVVIVLGLFIYLFNLDRKIKRLEKESGKG